MVGAPSVRGRAARPRSHRSPLILLVQMTSRTGLAKISEPPPGHESRSGSLQLEDDVLDRLLRDAAAIPVEFDHRPRLQVYSWEPLAQGAQEVGVVLVGRGGMQASDDVKLGNAVVPPSRGFSHGFFDCHGVAAGDPWFSRPGAEAAINPAEIRRVQVPVDVEVRQVRAGVHGPSSPAFRRRESRANQKSVTPSSKERRCLWTTFSAMGKSGLFREPLEKVIRRNGIHPVHHPVLSSGGFRAADARRRCSLDVAEMESAGRWRAPVRQQPPVG